jgi:hypothetical protein
MGNIYNPGFENRYRKSPWYKKVNWYMLMFCFIYFVVLFGMVYLIATAVAQPVDIFSDPEEPTEIIPPPPYVGGDFSPEAVDACAVNGNPVNGWIPGCLEGLQALQEPLITVPESDVYYLDAPTNEVFGIQKWRDHYGACALHNYQLGIELGKCQPSPEPLPECQDCFDGVGTGCLWKPKAESGPGAVLLMPSEYIGVSAFFPGANVVRTVVANGNRYHYFLDKRGDQLAAPLQVEFGNGHCLIIENPTVRND